MKVSSRLFCIFCFLTGFTLTLSAQKKVQAYVDYINQYKYLAIKGKDKYKVPASITLAQGLIESGAGTSELSRASNNHFGIKCHSDWTGDYVYRRDDTPNDCFRKYNTVEESFEDHAKFLLKYPRYAVLFTYNIRDYISWAKGLQTCGYATNPGYANSLIRVIEGYDLYQYDEKSYSEINVKSKNEKNKKPVLLRDVYLCYNMLYIIAKENDSFERISDETGFKVKDLAKYNEVPNYFPLKKGDIVWLEKKNKKADNPYLVHLVKIGDSMHSISQRYGIQMKHLYKMNKKDWDYAPTEGDVLRLR